MIFWKKLTFPSPVPQSMLHVCMFFWVFSVPFFHLSEPPPHSRRSPLRCCLLRTFQPSDYFFSLCHTCQVDKGAKTEAFPRTFSLSLTRTYLLSRVFVSLPCISVAGDDWPPLNQNPASRALMTAAAPSLPGYLAIYRCQEETQTMSIREALINKTCRRRRADRWIFPADRSKNHPQAVKHELG